MRYPSPSIRGLIKTNCTSALICKSAWREQRKEAASCCIFMHFSPLMERQTRVRGCARIRMRTECERNRTAWITRHDALAWRRVTSSRRKSSAAAVSDLFEVSPGHGSSSVAKVASYVNFVCEYRVAPQNFFRWTWGNFRFRLVSLSRSALSGKSISSAHCRSQPSSAGKFNHKQMEWPRRDSALFE